MAPHWKLTVEGFGKIEQAEVDVRPLTLFVGPNNTGKSYLASLIWGIVQRHATLDIPVGPEQVAVDALLRERLVKGGNLLLSDSDLAVFQSAFRAAWDANRSEVVQWVFNNSAVNAKRIDFSASQAQIPRKIPNFLLKSLMKLEPNSKQFEATRNVLIRLLGSGNLSRRTNFDDEQWRPEDAVYMPASRTGFMQLYKAAARRSLREAFLSARSDEKWLELTTPSYHFIELLTFGLQKTTWSEYIDESNLLQQQIHGRVEVVRGVGVNDYRYFPSGTSLSLPMGLSSSMVTEIAPLILVLRYMSEFPVLILEEPEAHLHPELQRRVAQVIVRLVRKGLIVVITTHSADFCQQINNFMKLGALSPDKRAEAQKKFGYESQDYLELDDVSGYEFKLDGAGEKTTVDPMKKHSGGLVMPTFNQSLTNLSDQVFALQDLLAEQEDAS